MSLDTPRTEVRLERLTAHEARQRLEGLHEQRPFREEQLQRLTAAHVEAALTRMDQGTYGARHLCREPIDRVRIVPQAGCCARCRPALREAGQ